MVTLNRIYTRTGDDGTTGFGGRGRISKNDVRLVAYAACDEANSVLGVVVADGAADGLDDDVRAAVTRLQNDLFDVGADLCTPVEPDPQYPPLRVTQEQVDAVESLIDHFNEPLETLRSFVLPGGTRAAAQLHVARTVVRRAERATWTAIEEHGETMNPLTAKYLNRASDLLFVLARYVNRAQGDVLWVPGANR
jgi:cob(I)alamin adenosyltransferase